MISNLIEIYLCSHSQSHTRIYFLDVNVQNPTLGTLYDDGELTLMRGCPMSPI